MLTLLVILTARIELKVHTRGGSKTSARESKLECPFGRNSKFQRRPKRWSGVDELSNVMHHKYVPRHFQHTPDLGPRGRGPHALSSQASDCIHLPCQGHNLAICNTWIRPVLQHRHLLLRCATGTNILLFVPVRSKRRVECLATVLPGYGKSGAVDFRGSVVPD